LALCQYLDGKIPLQEIMNDASFKPYDNSWVQPLTPAEKRELRNTAMADIPDEEAEFDQ